MSEIKVKAKVAKQLFYNDSSMYGGYSFYLISADGEIRLNKQWNNFVVVGSCPVMVEGKEYEFTIKPTWNKKYGDGYEFVEIQKRKLNTIEDQQEYLRQAISIRDANILIEAYPNTLIVDLIQNDHVDINNLKGIKESKLSKIKEKLSMYENLQLALVELKGLGITMSALQRLVNHFGSQDALIQKVKGNIYVLTSVELFGFIKVDEYAMKRGDDPTSPYRIKSCFEHVIKMEGKDGHSWVSVEELIKQSEALLKIETSKILDVVEELKENPDKFFIQGDKFSLKQYYTYEYQTKEHLDRLMDTYQKPSKTRPISKVEEENSIQYTNEQREAIELAQETGVFVLNGLAGSGKTTVLKGIIETLGSMNYVAVALSGKATKVLQSKGIRSSTIHRLLKVGANGRFSYNADNQLAYDVIILDEASMVNSFLFYSLVQAMQDGTKFIIVGDNGQLPAIGLAAVFDDLINTKKYPNKELTKIHRQAQKSGIITTANMIRNSKKINGRYEYDTKTFGELNDMVLIPLKSRENIYEHIVTISKGYFDKYGEKSFTDFQILTALKLRGENSVKNLNNELQGVFNDLTKDFVERNGYQFRQGDKIIQSGNNYDAIAFPDYDTYEKHNHFGVEFEELLEDEEVTNDFVKCSVFNGTVGRIQYINFEKKEVLIEFEDMEGLVLYTQQELSMIELAYAITIHRSQGIGVKNVLATFDYVAFKMLSKQLVYTAFTRASEKLVVVCENGALHQAIETDHGSTRRTFLKGLLLEEGVE